MNAPSGIRVTVATLTPQETGPLADAIAAAVRPAQARTYA